MSDEIQPCTSKSALGTVTQEETNDEEEEEEEESDIYDHGDGNPYTHEYIFKHEPFRYIPGPYYPDAEEEFSPPCLVFGIGLLCDEAVSYAEEHSLMGPPGSEYSATRLCLGFDGLARHFSQLYAPGRRPRITAETVLSLKCDVVLALFDNYSRPPSEDVERRREVRDIMEKLVNVFPAAFTRQGYFFSAMNETMYPPGFCRLLYKE